MNEARNAEWDREGVSLRDRRATRGRAARPGPPGHALLGRKILPDTLPIVLAPCLPG
jgi:hypothetical protein